MPLACRRVARAGPVTTITGLDLLTVVGSLLGAQIGKVCG